MSTGAVAAHACGAAVVEGAVSRQAGDAQTHSRVQVCQSAERIGEERRAGTTPGVGRVGPGFVEEQFDERGWFEVLLVFDNVAADAPVGGGGVIPNISNRGA